MKTIKTNLFAIVFATATVLALFNSQTTVMLTQGTGYLYIAALNSDAYKTLGQAMTNCHTVIY